MEEANVLIQEAKDILHAKFDVPDGIRDNGLDRLIDCIVGAAILETAELMSIACEPPKDENK